MAKRPTARSKPDDAAAPAAPKPKRARTAARKSEPSDAPREQEPVGPSSVEPSVDDIRRRAYERYLERGGNHGMHFDDWLEAEKELKRKK
jgi:hypothetical protein